MDSRISVRPFKGIIWDDISEFESHMPSHAVRSPSLRCEWSRHCPLAARLFARGRGARWIPSEQALTVLVYPMTQQHAATEPLVTAPQQASVVLYPCSVVLCPCSFEGQGKFRMAVGCLSGAGAACKGGK